MERDRNVPRQQFPHTGRAKRARDEQSRTVHPEHVHTAEQTTGAESTDKCRDANAAATRLALLPLRQEPLGAHQALLAQGRAHHALLGQARRQAQVHVQSDQRAQQELAQHAQVRSLSTRAARFAQGCFRGAFFRIQRCHGSILLRCCTNITFLISNFYFIP